MRDDVCGSVPAPFWNSLEGMHRALADVVEMEGRSSQESVADGL